MKFKFEIDDFVLVRLPSHDGAEGRTIGQMRVIERIKVKNNLFYKLDWTTAGKSDLLNSVSISENVLHEINN
jgi:hypothetical protein